MNDPALQARGAAPLDLSVAGWVLLAAALWELVASRVASVLGLYHNVGASGALAVLADSGQMATVILAVLSLAVAAVGLVRLCTDERFAALPIRVVMLFASPFALPIIAVSIFRPVQPQFVRVGYMGVVILSTFLMLICALHRLSGPRRRAALLLGAIPLLQAAGLLTGRYAVSDPSSFLGGLSHHSANLAQALYLAAPVLLVSWLLPGGWRGQARRPHALAAAIALLTAAVVVGFVVWLDDPVLFGLAAFRALGLTSNLPISPALYVLSAAVTAFVSASLLLPGSGDERRTMDDRRLGLGVLLIAMIGLHQFHPYRFAVLLAGFLYVARGLIGAALESIPRARSETPSIED